MPTTLLKQTCTQEAKLIGYISFKWIMLNTSVKERYKVSFNLKYDLNSLSSPVLELIFSSINGWQYINWRFDICSIHFKKAKNKISFSFSGKHLKYYVVCAAGRHLIARFNGEKN